MEDNSGRSVIANFGALGDMIHQDNVKMLTLLKDISDKLNEQSKFEEDSSISMQEIYDLLDRRLPEDGAQNVPKEILDKEGDIQNDDMLDRLDRIAAILEGMQNSQINANQGDGIFDDLSKLGKGAAGAAIYAFLKKNAGKLKAAGSALKGKGGGMLAAALGAYEIYDILQDDSMSSREKKIDIGGALGGAAGGWAGAKAGGAAGAIGGGAILGPAGAAVGGILGAVAGGYGGYTLGEGAGESISEIIVGSDPNKPKLEGSYNYIDMPTAALEKRWKEVGDAINSYPDTGKLPEQDQATLNALWGEYRTLEEEILKRRNSSKDVGVDYSGGGGSGSLSGGAGNDRLGVGGGGGGSSSGGILRANMRYVGNEEYVPSTRLSSKQMAEIEAGLAKGVVYPIDVLRDYYAQKNADTLSSETMMRQNSAEYGNGPTGDEILPRGTGGGGADSGMIGGGGSGNVDSSMYSGKNSGKLFDLIDKTEGGGNYDTLFGHSQRSGGRYSGVKVSEMTLGELYDFTDPNKPGGYGNWVGGQVGRFATPMGRYQIVGKTLRAVAQAMNLPPDTVFSPEIQDRMANYLASQRLAKGKTMAEKRSQLRAEWEGFKHVSNEDLDAAIRQFETSGSGTARNSTGSWLESGKAMGGNLMDLLSGMIDTGSDSGFISQMSQKAALARDLPAKAKTVVVPPAAPTPTATSTPYGTSNPDPGDPLPSISDFAKRIFDHSPMFKPQ